jgi:hypothetical protein
LASGESAGLDGDCRRCGRTEGTTKPIMKIDHISEHGIRRLVDEFYARVRADTELAPIFNRAIRATGGYTLRRCATFGRR